MLLVHGSLRLNFNRVLRCALLAVIVLSLFAGLPAGTALARPLMALKYLSPTELTAPGNNPGLGFGAPMALSGNTLVIGAPTAGNKGAVYIFERDAATGAWNATPTIITNANVANGGQFGVAVAIEYNTLVVGANMDSVGGAGNDTGAVYIYQRGPSGWDPNPVQGGTGFYTPARGDRFGESLAISGNTIAVGAPFFDPAKSIKNSGTVYIFKFDAGQNKWVYVKPLQDPGEIIKKNRNDMFGASLAVEGDTLVVGSSRANGACGGECGAVSVFSRNSGGADNWGRVGYFQSNPLLLNSFFGQAVAISGGRIVVGAPYATNSGTAGKAYVFEPVGSSWTQKTVLVASPATPAGTSDQFGSAVSIDGDLLVVGAKYYSARAGGVFAYTRSAAGAWAASSIPNPALTSPLAGDLFGSAVMVNGQSIIVGATGRTPSGGAAGQGAAYVFSLADDTSGNHPPELDLDGTMNGTGYLATFNEPAYPDTTFVAVPIINPSGLTVNDVDNGATLASATVTITNRPDGTKELLQASGTDIVHASYDLAAGVLTLAPVSGSASLADFQAVLRTVTYKNTSWKPDTSYRYINFVVNDGSNDSNMAVSTVVVVPAKERPVIMFSILGEAPYRINQPYTVRVSVARPGAVGAEAGIPSGDVTVKVGGGTCTAPLTTLNAPANAREGTCTVTMTTVGAMASSATYNGDSEFSAWTLPAQFMFDYDKIFIPQLSKKLP